MLTCSHHSCNNYIVTIYVNENNYLFLNLISNLSNLFSNIVFASITNRLIRINMLLYNRISVG